MTRSATPRLRFSRETLLLVASVSLCALLFEFTLRAVLGPSRYFAAPATSPSVASREKIVRGSPEGGSFGGLYETTPLGRRLRANTHGLIKNHSLSHRDIEIRTNDLGFRGAPLQQTPLPAARFLFLGDSVTLGDYLPEDETFIARVSKIAGTHPQTRNWELLNAGIGSVGIDNELALLKEKGPFVKPTGVVLNLYMNDVQPSPAVVLLSLPPVLGALWTIQYLWQAGSFAKYALSRDTLSTVTADTWETWRQQAAGWAATQNQLQANSAFPKQVEENFRDWGSAWSPSARDYLWQRVLEIQAESKRLGAVFAVAIHPVAFQVDASASYDAPQQDFSARLKAAKIPHLDLLPVLRKYAADHHHPQLFYDQCHHTPEGTHAIAPSLYALLRAL